MGQRIKLENVIAYYPKLFVPEVIKDSNNPDLKFSGGFILNPKMDLAPLQAITRQAAIDFFGANPPQGLKMPIKKCDVTGFEGSWMVSGYAKAAEPPQIIALDRMPLTDPKALFAGCIVDVVLEFYGYKNVSKGVACAIQIVRLVDNVNVTRLDNRPSVEDYFGEVAGAPAQTATSTADVQQDQNQGFGQDVARAEQAFGAQEPAGNGVTSGAPEADSPWNT